VRGRRNIFVFERDLAGSARDWEEVVDELERAHDYHWVHAINNTALVAAALHRFDGDFSGAICAAVQGGLDTDTNGAAVGSVLGALTGLSGIPHVWVEPLRGRFSTSLPGYDGATVGALAQRTLALAVEPSRA